MLLNMVDKTKDQIDLLKGIEHIGVYVGAIVHDGNGNVLLTKRGIKARDERGHWDICGGALEFGETIEVALRRELKEEICTQALSTGFLVFHDVHRIINGLKTHWLAVVYEARVNPTHVKIGEPDKIADLGWFQSKTLPSPLHSQFHVVLQAAKKAKIIK